MRIRVVYKKGDPVRFLSHLDLGRVLRMALKRAGWPVVITRGYSPKMKLSFYSPLPVGTAGEEEYMDVFLDKSLLAPFTGQKDLDWLLPLTKRLSAALPRGMSVNDVFCADGEIKSFESTILGSLYEIQIEEVNKKQIRKAAEAFFDREQVLFEIKRPGGTRTVDLREFVQSITMSENGADNGITTFFMRIGHDNGRTVRPQWVVESFSEFGLAICVQELIVDRLKLYFE